MTRCASDEPTPRAPRSFGKGRLEAFSDGVFAIAITLLVLDFAIHPPGSPLHQVLHIWPAFVAYLISFLTIGAAWLGHTALTDRLARTDSVLLRLNLLLLLAVTFLPFPTGLVGEALREPSSERVFVTLYGCTLLAIRLLGIRPGRLCRLRAPLRGERRRGGAKGATTTSARRPGVCDRDPHRDRVPGSSQCGCTSRSRCISSSRSERSQRCSERGSSSP